METDPGTAACSPNNLVSFEVAVIPLFNIVKKKSASKTRNVQTLESGNWNTSTVGRRSRFIDDAEIRDNITVLWLSDELGDGANVIEGTLSIGYAHDAVEPIDRALFARVIPWVLRTR